MWLCIPNLCLFVPVFILKKWTSNNYLNLWLVRCVLSFSLIGQNLRIILPESVSWAIMLWSGIFWPCCPPLSKLCKIFALNSLLHDCHTIKCLCDIIVASSHNIWIQTLEIVKLNTFNLCIGLCSWALCNVLHFIFL